MVLQIMLNRFVSVWNIPHQSRQMQCYKLFSLICIRINSIFFFFRRPENVKVPDWLWDGAGWGPSGEARRAPDGGVPQPVRDFYVFRASEKEKGEKISESFKPQTKAIFYLELIPLQHIKSSGL